MRLPPGSTQSSTRLCARQRSRSRPRGCRTRSCRSPSLRTEASRVPEPEVVQVSLASIQVLPDPGEDLSRIVALDEIREFLGEWVELFHERRPPLILVHGPKVTSESTAAPSTQLRYRRRWSTQASRAGCTFLET